MKTRDICEALLTTPNAEVVKEALTLLHILNDDDRNYQPKVHSEYVFMEDFEEPIFVAIADKQWRVYVIGSTKNCRRKSILEIDGFTVSHLQMSITALKDRIYESSVETRKLFLPEGDQQRVICIQPNYEEQRIDDEDIFIFNKVRYTNNFYSKSTWTIGVDIYNPTKYEHAFKTREILDQVFADLT